MPRTLAITFLISQLLLSLNSHSSVFVPVSGGLRMSEIRTEIPTFASPSIFNERATSWTQIKYYSIPLLESRSRSNIKWWRPHLFFKIFAGAVVPYPIREFFISSLKPTMTLPSQHWHRLHNLVGDSHNK